MSQDAFAGYEIIGEPMPCGSCVLYKARDLGMPDEGASRRKPRDFARRVAISSSQIYSARARRDFLEQSASAVSIGAVNRFDRKQT